MYPFTKKCKDVGIAVKAPPDTWFTDRGVPIPTSKPGKVEVFAAHAWALGCCDFADEAKTIAGWDLALSRAERTYLYTVCRHPVAAGSRHPAASGVFPAAGLAATDRRQRRLGGLGPRLAHRGRPHSANPARVAALEGAEAAFDSVAGHRLLHLGRRRNLSHRYHGLRGRARPGVLRPAHWRLYPHAHARLRGRRVTGRP